ncbi:MAG: hypothetical protein JRN52_16145 [Nitrososphaerota archaeon]|nr:hypothetical protein [Nitrososphaerota archaeon]
MTNKAKGVGSAVFVFILVGIVAPYAINYFRPLAERFAVLPPSQEIWMVFIFFGVVYAVVEYLQNAYAKGEYLWLAGRLGSGAASLGLFSYIFFYMIGSSSLSSEEGVDAAGLVTLIYVSIGLSYLYLFLDFYDARRSRRTVNNKTSSPVTAEPNMHDNPA